MGDLEEDLIRWNTSRDISLAYEICEKLHSALVTDRCTDGLMEGVAIWGREKEINDPIMQFAKLNEEVGEIAHELTRLRFHGAEIEDALGDTFVTLIILADILGYDLHDCLAEAYDQIKNRRGKTKGGSFIKDAQD